VASETLGAKQINEGKLTGGLGADIETTGTCDPSLGVPVDCIGRTVRLQRNSGLLIVATGAKTSEGGQGACEIAVDGSTTNGQTLSGETQDSFALTQVTAPLGQGRHSVAMQCVENGGNLRIDDPTISIATVGALPN